MLQPIMAIVFCHLLGDYVLQIDMLARTKGENWYHLIVHCVLYVLPFFLVFGSDWRLALIFVDHVIVDALKARYKAISYTTDQILHYIAALIYLLGR